jgi:hypothetical protein
MFNRNMENHPGQQCNHKNYMALVLAEKLGKSLCGHYSHSSLGTEECFYGSSIPEWYWNGSTMWLSVHE